MLNIIADRNSQLFTRMRFEAQNAASYHPTALLPSSRMIKICQSEEMKENCFLARVEGQKMDSSIPFRREWPKGDIINAIYFLSWNRACANPIKFFGFPIVNGSRLILGRYRSISFSNPSFCRWGPYFFRWPFILLFRSHIVPINCLFAVMIYDSFLTETDFSFSQ